LSGWIKFEKDVRTDPRFLRMRKSLLASDVTQVRITPTMAATLLAGCLVELWCYADTHIREDDTLDLGTDEIDELVGVEGFAALMPADWLEVIDQHCVKLPGFQEHNGTDAKKKAQTQKRVARHRVRTVTQERNEDVAECNAGALPDQTRPDQTKPDKTIRTGVVPQSGTAKRDSEEVLRVFDHWRTTHGHPKATLDDKRRKKIREALKGYSEADVCQAITGYLNSPHHMGENDQNTKYTDLELLIRDSSHIDRGLEFFAKPPRTDLSAQTRRIVSQTEDWSPPETRRASN
jgi:hypothetical protein